MGLKWSICLLHYLNVYGDSDKILAKRFPPLLKDPLLLPAAPEEDPERHYEKAFP